ncbi:MAG TPA: hypothetical protein VGC45_06860 [Gryllotalpicola sp.]
MLGFLCRLGHVATTAELNRSYRDSGFVDVIRRGFAGAFTPHWSALRFPGMERAHPAAYKLAVPVPEALRQSMSCLAGDQLVHAIQTALLTTPISRADATRLLALAPARLAAVLRVVDPARGRR